MCTPVPTPTLGEATLPRLSSTKSFVLYNPQHPGHHATLPFLQTRSARGVAQDVSQRAQRAGADGKWAIPRWSPLHPYSSYLLWLRSSPRPFHWEQLILALSDETFNESDDKTHRRVDRSLGVSGSSVKSFSLGLDQRKRKQVICSFGSWGQPVSARGCSSARYTD